MVGCGQGSLYHQKAGEGKIQRGWKEREAEVRRGSLELRLQNVDRRIAMERVTEVEKGSEHPESGPWSTWSPLQVGRKPAGMTLAEKP